MNNCQKCGPIDPVETSYRTTQCGCTATSCNNIVSEGCVSGLKISNMPEPTHIAGDDLIPLVHHGSNVAITLEHFLLEASQILEKCPESALNISKEARDRALVALTTAEQACQTAKCAAQKATTNADSICNIVKKDNSQDAQICTLQTQNLTLTANLEQLQNSLEECSKSLNVTVATSFTPTSVKYLFKKGSILIATVEVPTTDSTLSLATAAADALATGQAISRVQESIPKNVSQLVNDSNYVAVSVGDTRWLLKTEAAATYLTKSDASSIYLDKESAQNTFVNVTDASNKYLSKVSASDIYLTKASAQDTYETIADLTTKLADITTKYQALASRITALESNYNAIKDTYATKTDLTKTNSDVTALTTRVTTLESK